MAKRSSPQSRWSKRKKGAGRCARCGKPRNRYAQLCDKHQAAVTAYMRQWRAARREAAKENAKDAESNSS